MFTLLFKNLFEKRKKIIEHLDLLARRLKNYEKNKKKKRRVKRHFKNVILKSRKKHIAQFHIYNNIKIFVGSLILVGHQGVFRKGGGAL